MFIKNSTLLIGKSLIIKKAIFHLFKNKKIRNLSFRKSWDNLNLIESFDDSIHRNEGKTCKITVEFRETGR